MEQIPNLNTPFERAKKIRDRLVQELEDIVTGPENKTSITTFHYDLLSKGERIPYNMDIDSMLPRIVQDIFRIDPDERIAVYQANKDLIFFD